MWLTLNRQASIALLSFLLALAGHGALAGCGTEDEPSPEAPIPADLVGAWNVITPNGSAFSYEISAKGFYVHVGIMRDGTQQYTLQESGTIEVRGDQVIFRPDSVTISRSDSSLPAENDREETTRPARTVTWAVATDNLTLTENGASTTYRRE